MWPRYATNPVLILQLLCLFAENKIGACGHIQDYVCEVGQEKDGKGVKRWVLPHEDPCMCTRVISGGMNTITPSRPFNPIYVDTPWIGDNIRKIRKHYNLNCTDIDECDAVRRSCGGNAVCIETKGSFTCKCNVGFAGDGFTCIATWGTWDAWGTCQTTCGDGSRTRVRICADSDTCGGEAPIDTESCNDGPCALWGAWGAWGTGSATCGDGSHTREKICADSDITDDITCDGVAPVDTGSCNDGPCATWGDWGAWGTCSATCGDGSHTRETICADSDITDDITCDGVAPVDTVSCNDGPCATWGDWGAWGTCSATCGDGSHTREKNCADSDITDDITCDGDAPVDTGSCNDGPCVCSDYLGMKNGDIPDENIKASSDYDNYQPWKARLHGPSTWLAKYDETTPWIQADIGFQTYVFGVIIEGDGDPDDPDYIASFKVSTWLSTDMSDQEFIVDDNGEEKLFPGNTDSVNPVEVYFPEPVLAQVVRITCVEKYDNSWRMRFEILGCKRS